LLLLCVLWAGPSLRSDLLPGLTDNEISSSLASQAILLALFSVIAAIAACVRKAPRPRAAPLRTRILAGLGLFAVPTLLIQAAKANIDDTTRVALFSLAPVFAVVFEPHLGSPSAPPQRGALAASLVAVCGTLLVFPLDLPHSSATALAFCGILAAIASIAAANCLSVRLAQEESAPSMLSFAAIATGSAAVSLGVSSAFFDRHPWTSPRIDLFAALDLLALVLLFWLMRRMTAVRMTTRFLIAPLLANLVGLAFLHPGVQPRAWLGLALISAGSAWLLLAPKGEPDETGSPLGIN
jgi:drug/metabolite transporter (DMT)-like permease